MNIKLLYNKSSFKVDILKDTPCQYLFEVTQKIFRIPIDSIILKYEGIEIPNNSRLVFSVMGKTDPDNITGDETIYVSRKSKLSSSNNDSFSNLRESVKLPIINSSINNDPFLDKIKKKKKKGGGSPITCQICNLKNSIFYCRVCNLFVCFECNVRFNEHKNHERINLEDGDSFLGCDVYREELINEINVIEIGYQKTLQWNIGNEERENFLQQLFKLLEQIRNNSLTLADMKTLYSVDQDIINDFRIEIDKIPKPRHKEEILEIYGNLNLKENELRNYIKYLNLQIIRTEYNKVLLKCLDKVKNNLEILSKEVKTKLNECEDIKFKGIEDVQVYIKESKLPKNQMDIGNYLSNNYEENKYINNSNNNIINSNSNLTINKVHNSEYNSSFNKNSSANFNIISNNNNSINNNFDTINTTSKNNFNRNNNSLFNKRITLTVEKNNKPIKIIENQKKKISLNIEKNNLKSESKERYSNFKLDLSPLSLSKKTIFKIKDNNNINNDKTNNNINSSSNTINNISINKKNNTNNNKNNINNTKNNNKSNNNSTNNIISRNSFTKYNNKTNDESKTKINKINLVSKKPKEAQLNDFHFINFVKNKKEKNQDNNISNNIIDNNSIINKSNSITNINMNKKSKKTDKIMNDNDLIIKPSDEDEALKNELNLNNSIYQTLTSSEKKIVFSPPLIKKHNSYGKTILNKKNNLF